MSDLEQDLSALAAHIIKVLKTHRIASDEGHRSYAPDINDIDFHRFNVKSTRAADRGAQRPLPPPVTSDDDGDDIKSVSPPIGQT